MLVRMTLGDIMSGWRPGSASWDWEAEQEDLWTRHRDVTEAVERRVLDEGVDFADDHSPVLLGNDGRVWDGHHRICIAAKHKIPALMVDVVPPNRNYGDS